MEEFHIPGENPVSSASAPTKLARHTQILVQQIEKQSPDATAEPTFHADESNKVVYEYYEKVRNAVEYREHHLFLRAAIGRYLNRNILLSGRRSALGSELLGELTKTRYIANDSIPRRKLTVLNQMIDDYRSLLSQLGNMHSGSRLERLNGAVIDIASSDIERLLLPDYTAEHMTNFTYTHLRNRLDPQFIASHPQPDLERSLYIATLRLLQKADAPHIRYYLFYAEYPYWRSNAPASIVETAATFDRFITTIDSSLRSPLTNSITKMVRKLMPAYHVLHLAVRDKGPAIRELFANPDRLEGTIRLVAEQEYLKSQAKVRASVIRAIIFIFLTKVTLAFVLELPYDRFIEGEIHWPALIINVLFPPLYLAAIGLSTRMPGLANTEKLMSMASNIAFDSEPEANIKPRQAVRSGSLRRTFGILYALGFVVSTGLLIRILFLLNFNIVSGLLFFVFFSTVSFFGVKVLGYARELEVINQRSGFLGTILEILYAPFIRFGQWLSDTYSRINFFSAMLDVMIELPFKTVLRVLDEWSDYLRDKQDDVL